jgi:hypothetical protein
VPVPKQSSSLGVAFMRLMSSTPDALAAGTPIAATVLRKCSVAE